MMLEVAIKKKQGAFTLDVAFTAPLGVTAIFGKSGSGKTSVVNAVAGLMQPDEGCIVVGDTVLFDDAVDLTPQKRRVGYVFQDARLFPHMNVARNLTYGGDHDADRVIAVLGLGDLLDRRPAGLSGGERQRVALGRPLMSNPQILLMDEPCSALDPASTAKIEDLIFELRKQYTIVIVTHNMQQAARCSDRTAFFFEGKIIEDGPTRDLFTNPKSQQTEDYVTGKFG